MTGFAIFYFYASSADAKDWEEEVLGSAVMLHGQTRRVTLNKVRPDGLSLPPGLTSI